MRFLAQKITKKILIAAIMLYQNSIGLVLTSSCRFHPSCSCYAIEAIEIHGPIVGLWLAIKRLTHCHPWGKSGSDPVPKAKTINKPPATT